MLSSAASRPHHAFQQRARTEKAGVQSRAWSEDLDGEIEMPAMARHSMDVELFALWAWLAASAGAAAALILFF
ncbi:hypothetical protein ACFQU1_24050 [Chelatococcus sp. GCM10030263]|uniref:hypothetical protein n=1 Tax=Chelatococcus sp. GCM10030263 TaxID=3273387 RepID=UPI0036201BD1